MRARGDIGAVGNVGRPLPLAAVGKVGLPLVLAAVGKVGLPLGDGVVGNGISVVGNPPCFEDFVREFGNGVVGNCRGPPMDLGEGDLPVR